MIIEAPHAFTPGRFELKHLLQSPDQVEVSDKHARDECLLVFWTEHADQAQYQQVGEERQFVTCAIVQSSC